MQEYLVFEVWVPIETPDINPSTQPYRDVVEFRKKEAIRVFEDQLPNDWTFDFATKIPQ